MLRMSFIFIMAGLALPAWGAPAAAPAAATASTSKASPVDSRESALRRVVALLDYVSGDYARAVSEQGGILVEDEHREQVGFISEAARELLAELQLQGRPIAFASAEDVKALTPQRAFSAVTYGVPNTSMPSFEEAFDDRSRWDLAFYLLSLARGPGDAKGLQLARNALVPTG